MLKEAGIEYKGGNAGAVKALFDYYYEKYTTDTRIMPVQRRAFTLDNAKREAAADFAGKVLFKGKEYRSEIADALKYGNELPDGDYETSLSALNELAQKDKRLFNRIIEAVKRFISNLRGHKTNNKLVADLEKLERKLKKVYESTETKRPTEDIGEKFQLKDNLSQQLKDWLSGNGQKKGSYNGSHFDLGTTPDVLIKHGAKSTSLIMYPSCVEKITGGKHSIALDEIAKLPEQLNDPILLFKGSVENSFVALTEIIDKSGNDVIAAIHINKKHGRTIVNRIASLYSKTNDYGNNRIISYVKNQIEQGNLIDASNKKAPKWFTTRGLQLPNVVQTILDANDSIRQNAQNSQENFSDKEQFSLGNSRLDELRYRPEMFAKRLINKYHLKADPKEVARKIQKIITEHNKGGRELTTNSDGEWSRTLIADGLADELAKEIAGTVKLNITDEAQEILKAIRGVKVCVNHRQLQEIEYKYGSLTEYRKQTGLWITAASNTRLDSQWQEWAELYPQYFDSGINSVDMPGEYASIVERLKNSREEVDNSELAEAIAGDIKETLESTGPKAHEREKNQAVKEAVKKARAEEREKAAKDFDDYRKKESERKYNEAVSKRKREYRERAVKLRDKFTKMLEKPKKGSYVPLPFIRAVVDALDIIYDNPIEYDDSKIGGKYAARLEKLNQDIQNATDPQTKAELKEHYDRLFRTATNAADRVIEIKKMFDALKSEDAYEKVYNDAGDNKLFGERAQMYDESISKMLEVLSRELGDTEAYNYNEHQLRIISEVFTALDKHIHDYNTLIGRQERVEVSEAAEKFIDEVMRSHGDFKVLNKAVLAQMSPMRLFRMLGNYETGSQAETIADELDKGQRKSIEYTMKAEQMIENEILGNNELFKETRKMFSTKENDLVDSGLVDENGNKVMITRGMRLSLVMHGRNEQNRNAVMGGVEIPKDLENYYKNGAAKSKSDTFKAVVPTDALQWFTRLNSSLSDIEKKWIGVLDKYYSEISAPALNETTMQVFGFKKATVKNYWRKVRTEHFLDKPVDTVVRDALLEHAGYLEKRKNAKNPIFLMDAIDQLQNDIENHANYYGLVIPLSNFSKVYNYAQYDFENEKWGTSVKETIDNKYSGGAVTGYIENLIADLNGARKREVSIFDRIRGRYAQAVLSLNPRVAVKQTASYPTAAAVIGWKPLIKALAVVEKENGDKKFVFARAELDEIAKYSPLLWYRMRGNMDTELGNLKETGSPGDKLAKKMPALLGWINKMDAATVGRLWYASKYYVEDNFKYKKGTPQFYKKTAEIFEKVIEETQPNYTVMQRPAVLRSTNALTRAVTMFYTQRLQNANILFDSTMEWRAKSKAYKNASESGKVVAEAELKEARAKFGRAVSSQAVSLVVLNVMELVIRAALSQMKPYRDKDTDEVSEEAIYRGLGDACLETLFGTVVFGSEIYDAIKLGVGAAKGQYYGIQVPAVETINDTVNLFINDGNWIKDTAVAIKDGKMTMNDFAEQLTARTLDNIIKVVQPFTGIPVKNAKDMISGIVHSAMGMFNGDLFKYEAEVADNAYNRIVGAKTRTNTQYYRTLAEAVINDDREKYESTLKRFINDTKPDKTTLTGIKSALKDTEAVKSETEKALGEVSKNKTYKGLSDKGKKDVETSVAGVIVNEKLLSVGKQRSKKFGQLYEYKRKKNKTAYERLKKELASEGLSESDIEIGEEIAKFKFLGEQGISVSEWFTAKKALSEENARKNAEKYKAIQKMDFSAKDKKALWENLK